MWKKVSIFLLGVITALLIAFKLQKPTTINNVENNTKIKKNLAPVKLDNNTKIEPKKKRFRLFRKRKK